MNKQLFTYDEEGIGSADLNFTDIHGPDGMVPVSVILPVLNDPDVIQRFFFGRALVDGRMYRLNDDGAVGEEFLKR